ncbi:YncE family protein [Kushneria sinocarnis]|nr:YncE family protein [Kushneria sinocarnis]
MKTLLIGAGLTIMPLAAAAAPHVDHSARVGSGVHEVVHADHGNRLFVTATGASGDDGGGAVLQLDPESLKLQQRIAMPARAYGLAMNHETGMLYTTNTDDRSVSVIDAASGEVIKTLKLERDEATVLEGEQLTRPHEAVVDEAHNRIYISGVSRDGVIWVLDGKSNELTDAIEGIGDTPTGVALDTENQNLYVTLRKSDAVIEINLDNHSVTRRYDTQGSGPVSVALDRQRQRLLVANRSSGSVDVIDLGSGQTQQSIDTGAGAMDITLDDEGERIYVTNHDAGTVTILDADDYNRLADLDIGAQPEDVAVEADGRVAWVTGQAGTDDNDTSAEGDDGAREDTVSRILSR